MKSKELYEVGSKVKFTEDIYRDSYIAHKGETGKISESVSGEELDKMDPFINHENSYLVSLTQQGRNQVYALQSEIKLVRRP